MYMYSQVSDMNNVDFNGVNSMCQNNVNMLIFVILKTSLNKTCTVEKKKCYPSSQNEQCM